MRLLFFLTVLLISPGTAAQLENCDDLQVSASLQIIRSDCDSTIVEGYTVGAPDLQWYLDGQEIPGANNTFLRLAGSADGSTIGLQVTDGTVCNLTEFLIAIPGGCPKEDCANGQDDDGDGLIDLQDVEACTCGLPPDQLDGELFPNPGFEARRDIPGCERCYAAGQQFPCVDGWILGNSISTIEHILRCFTLRFPSRFTPYVSTQGNFSMIGGFFAYDDSEFHSMESVIVPLREPTIPGERYRLVFEADLAGGDVFDRAEEVSGSVFQYLNWYTSPVLDSFPYRFRSINEVEFGGSWENWTVLDSVAIAVNDEFVLERFEIEFIAPPTPIRVMAFAGARRQPRQDAFAQGNMDYEVYWVMDNASLRRVTPPAILPVDLDATVRVVPFLEEGQMNQCQTGLRLTVPNESNNSYQWYRNGIAIQDSTDATFSISAVALDGSSYQVRILSEGACKVSEPVIARPVEPFVVSFSVDSLRCADLAEGGVSLDVIPDTSTYTLNWEDAQGNFLGSQRSLSGLTMGDYYLTITDVFSCEYVYPFSLSAPSPLALELTAEDVDCNAADGLGLLSLSVTGGTPPYEVFLNDELVVTSPSYQRPPGTYTARIIDAQGCEIVANPVPIRAPEEFLGALRPNQTILTLGNSTTVRLQSNRSLGAAQIIWEPASWVSCQNCSETTIRPRSSGVLRAFLTDEDGCQAQDAVLIQVIPDQSVYLPTAISPNGDGVNDVFRAYAGPAVQEVLSLSVYDRWGGLYFHGKGEGAQWAPGSEAATGLYIYQLEVLFLNGMKELLRGGVMLMR